MNTPRSILASSIAALLAFAAVGSEAALVTYSTDANTIQLWHLDEAAGGSSFAGPLTFGNENRNVSAEGLLGMIDEIRISNIARPATGFLFTVIPGGSFWNVDANGNWDIAGNWTVGGPNAVSAEASLGGGGTAITAPRTITLNGTKTLGKLNFSNAAQGFTLGSGGVTDALNAAPVIVTSGTLGFNRSDSLAIANDIGGGGTVKQSGSATLTLTGNNSFGAVAASADTVKVGSATSPCRRTTSERSRSTTGNSRSISTA